MPVTKIVKKPKKLDVTIEPCQLITAASEGDFERVKLLVNHGATVDSDVLEAAIDNGNIRMIDYLVHNGAEVNGNILAKASVSGQYDVVKYLVGQASTEIIHPALMVAIDKGDLKMVDYLYLVHRQNCYRNDEPNDRGYILMRAVASGQREVVEYLVRNGVDLHRHRTDAVKLARDNGFDNIAQYLSHVHDFRDGWEGHPTPPRRRRLWMAPYHLRT